MLDEGSLASPEVPEAGIPLERQHELAVLDPGRVEQRPHDLFVLAETAHRQKCLDDLALPVPVRRESHLNAGDTADAPGRR